MHKFILPSAILMALVVSTTTQAQPASKAERVASELKGVWDVTIDYREQGGNLHVHLDFSDCNSASDCNVVVRNQEPENNPLTSESIPARIDKRGIVRFFEKQGPAQGQPSNSCPLKFLAHGGDFKLSLKSDGSLQGDVYVHAGKPDHCGSFTGGTKLAQ